jgi:hypothetical protein
MTEAAFTAPAPLRRPTLFAFTAKPSSARYSRFIRALHATDFSNVRRARAPRNAPPPKATHEVQMLFIVMLGGKHRQAKIEVHDVVFVAGDSLQGCYRQLRESWFGLQDGLHIDSWLEVDGIEDYRIQLSALAPAAGEPRLYFINLGGYERGVFGEAHRYVLVTARNKTEAKALGKQRMLAGWLKPHTDALLDVDDCLPVDQAGGHYVHLVRGPHRGIVQRSDYLLLDRQ